MFAPDVQGSASAPRDHASVFPEATSTRASTLQRESHAGANDHPSAPLVGVSVPPSEHLHRASTLRTDLRPCSPGSL